MPFSLHFRMASAAIVALVTLASTFAMADEAPETPEDATVYSGGRVVEYKTSDDPDATKALGLFVQPGFRSDSLRGDFVGKPMFIMLDGKKLSFWGARAVALDPDSPLRKLGIEVGDVVTHLDGVAVDNEKVEQNKSWQMPELERHYGATEVKWVKQGAHRFNVGEIDLGDAVAAETASLWNQFAIRLLPGFKHVQLQGIDSLPGKLVHTDGREIHYDIGRYYPPGGLRTGGAFENQALKSAEGNCDVVVKQQMIGGLTFYVAHTAKGLTISTVSVPNRQGINFSCAAKTPNEVADVLLMVLSLQTPPAVDEPPASPRP